MLGITAAVFAASALLSAIWIIGIRRWYRLGGTRPQLLRATCADGWSLGVFYRPAAVKRYAEPVVLAHGLAVTHLNLDFEPPYSIAAALSDAGFDCFSVDWRGNGASGRPPPGRHASDYCVDDHIALDGPALVALALQVSGAKEVFWLGHSLGGLVGYALAAREEGARIRGLMTLGSPAFFVDASRALLRVARWMPWLAWPRRIRQRFLTLGLAPFLGWFALPLAASIVNPLHVEPHLQRKLFAHLFVGISRKILLQFREWILHGTFRSFDGRTDYRAGMSTARVPALIAAGALDRIATPASVAAAFELWGGTDKTLVVFGRANGNVMDYGHGDLVFGRGAPTEVYPLLRRWLEAHATATDHSPEARIRTQGEGGDSTSERSRET